MSIHELQVKLYEHWATRRVDEAYQKMFLSHIDVLGEEEAGAAISAEIKRLMNHNSRSDELSKLKKYRETALAQARTEIHNM